MRSWRSALDRIYYHNAYRVAPNYRPSTETDKALQESLRNMELQCKERVEILEALRDSRKEAGTSHATGKGMKGLDGARSSETPVNTPGNESLGFIGSGTIPVVNYPDLAKPDPALPPRPPPQPIVSNLSDSLSRADIGARSSSLANIKPLSPNPGPVVLPKTSRTPSPEKAGRSKMKTTLRPGKDNRRMKPRETSSTKTQAASSKAAGLAWDSNSLSPLPGSSGQSLGQTLAGSYMSVSSLNQPSGRDGLGYGGEQQRSSLDSLRRDVHTRSTTSSAFIEDNHRPASHAEIPPDRRGDYFAGLPILPIPDDTDSRTAPISRKPAFLPQTALSGQPKGEPPIPHAKPPDFPSYRSEYPAPTPVSQASIAAAVNPPRSGLNTGRSSLSMRPASPSPKVQPAPPPPPPPPHRRPVANASSPRSRVPEKVGKLPRGSSSSAEDTTRSQNADKKTRRSPKFKQPPENAGETSSENSSGRDSPEGSLESQNWEERLAYIKKNLPKGVDPWAAKQIFNEIVVKGDEVHWSDVAGLEQAKTALKEAVVYPFLRPDLFMGLREPARGMLLFGPPGTGKTMLARAVATESRSTFFAISASSLTSKWLGESEKLVRALFALARALAPSIIFVDEIDSLLSSRGGSSEHESTRRIKTEFLIQWSDLQRAAAGKEQTEKEKRQGDASRVLVLAATNLPWAIDDAARRRFVRRQYIPLPEAPVREEQLRTLLSHQKHSLSKKDVEVLVKVTDSKLFATGLPHFTVLIPSLGYSGSDITALAKDAAMGPLRSLGEALLRMSMDEIRPINFDDFESSLMNIRPSVSKQGLKEFEDWAREFGERGG